MKLCLCLLPLLLFSSSCTAEPENNTGIRICTLSSAAAVFLGQLDHAPAAVDEFSAPFAAQNTPVAGKGVALSAEKLLELNINTLIVWEYQFSAVRHLARYGIRIVTLPHMRLHSIPEFIEKLGKLTRKEKEAVLLSDEFRKKLSSIKPAAASRRVYLELYTRNCCAGRNSYAGDLLAAAGGKNIFEKTLLTGSDEIIRRDPEVIFYVEHCTGAAEIMARPGMSNVTAVKNKKVFPVPRRLLVEGAAPFEAVEYLKKRIF